MKISFDLDDTIIPGITTFDTERQPLLQKMLRQEKIRKGVIALFKELKRRGHTIGVYTTSFRSKRRIKLLFLLYGFPIDFVINQKFHLRQLNKGGIRCSKYPKAFGIDLHIDDSKGVEMEGVRYGFDTVIIAEDELDWCNVILDRLK